MAKTYDKKLRFEIEANDNHNLKVGDILTSGKPFKNNPRLYQNWGSFLLIVHGALWGLFSEWGFLCIALGCGTLAFQILSIPKYSGDVIITEINENTITVAPMIIV